MAGLSCIQDKLYRCGSTRSQSPVGRRRGILRALWLPAAALTMSACSTLHVPLTKPTFGPDEFAVTETEGIVLRARTYVGTEIYSDLFDDDLPRLGIIAAWVSIENRGRQEVTVDPKRWRLIVAGHRCPAMPPNDMMDRYYRERGIRFYTVRADESARARLEKLSLQPGQIAPGISVEGFVFFRIDGPPLPSRELSATLQARGINLGAQRKLDMQLPLHAHS